MPIHFHTNYFKGFIALTMLISLSTKGQVSPRQITSMDFIENKGQWDTTAKYMIGLPAGAMFITDKGYVYAYTSKEDLETAHEERGEGIPKSLHHHAYKVNFVNANRDIQYQSLDKRAYYHNYFRGNDSTKWNGNVGLFGKVLQRNIYNGIDVATYSKNGFLKYDFIIAAGANPETITLSYEGVKPELTPEGKLSIKTTVNEIIEQAPYAYQVINGQEVAVPCRYRLSDRQVTFSLPAGYDTHYPLVIDPAVVFSTFSGSSSLQIFGQCTTFDTSGNLYTGAGVYYPFWPTTTGAFMTSAGSVIGIAISKYNASGSDLVYATYLNGSGSQCDGGDLIRTMIVNAAQELIVVGHAQSEDFPVTAGCYQDSLKPGGYNSGCGRDLFVTHFNSTGSALIGSTFIGGNHDETGGLNNPEPNSGGHQVPPIEVAIDALGNIWVTSLTVSNNFPITSNAVGSYMGLYTGMYGCVVFQLSPDCSQLMYSTYLGGANDNIPYDIKINHAGQVVVCGKTYKYNPEYMPDIPYSIPTTPGTIHPAALGDGDGFVTIIDPSTGGIAASTYIGTSSADAVYSLAIDEHDNVYVLGHTFGDYPVSAGAYTIPGGDAALFIDKLTPDLSSSLLSTRIGMSAQVPGINPQFGTKEEFMPTSFMVDQCGNTYISGIQAANDLPVTSDAFMSMPRRFWMGVLETDFSSLRFATYFGAPLPNIWYTAYWHLFDHLHAGRHHSDPQRGLFYHSICAGIPSNFPTTLGSFSPGSWAATADAAVFKFDFSAFAQKDTFITQSNSTLCFSDSILIKSSSSDGFNYLWNTGIGSDSLWVNQSATYAVQYRKNELGCNLYVDSIHVDKVPLPAIVAGDTVCTTDNGATAWVSVPGNNEYVYTYNWFNAITGNLIRTTSGSEGDTIEGLEPGLYGIQITTVSGCDTILPVNLEGWLSPDLTVSPYDTTINYGDTIQLHVSGAYLYTWAPTGSLDTPTIPNPLAVPVKPTRYEVIGVSEKGCKDTAYVYVNIDYNMPDMTPNAFSPNGDGLNDIFRIEGVKYQKIHAFTIFNRFGERVFSASNSNDGWDGNYKGQPCDMGTYYYLAELVYPDGITKMYKGDVTLIR